MIYQTTAQFDRSFRKLSQEIKTAFRKQIGFLLKDMRYPSLRAKKYDESHDIWQARVNDNVRFYFNVIGNCYLLLDIEKHGD